MIQPHLSRTDWLSQEWASWFPFCKLCYFKKLASREYENWWTRQFFGCYYCALRWNLNTFTVPELPIWVSSKLAFSGVFVLWIVYWTWGEKIRWDQGPLRIALMALWEANNCTTPNITLQLPSKLWFVLFMISLLRWRSRTGPFGSSHILQGVQGAPYQIEWCFSCGLSSAEDRGLPVQFPHGIIPH